MALSLYRKYRPEVFADVVGQEHVEKTLINAVSEGTVAHAYLFCGPRGTGKTTTARLLAKALLCEAGPSSQPDGTCPQCLEIAQGTHPDVFELDAASRTGVDNVREEIIGRVGFAPTRGRSKVYIIDEVHMLSTAAFNALLKTLEEPPEHVVFVLCTTDPHKVPETIQSRCQRFDFRRFSIEEIMGYLERISTGEGFTYEPEALEFIAAKSAGGMRDATTSLEQVAVYTDGKITLDEATRMFGQIDMAALFEIAGYIAARDTAACFTWIHDLVGKGVDLSQFARDLAAHLRNLYVTAITGGENGIVACTAAQLARYRQQAADFGGVDRLARALDLCGALVFELRNSSDARLSVEIAMTRLTRPDSELTLESLAERVESLELRGPVGDSLHNDRLPDGPQGGAYEDQVPRAGVDVAQDDDLRRGRVSRGPQAAQRSDVPGDIPPWEDAASLDAPTQAHVAQTEPEPMPVPAVSAAAPAEMSTERVLAAVLCAVRRDDEAVGALLSGVSLTQEGDVYHLLFPTGADFQMKLAGEGNAKELIGKAFVETLGHEARFDYRIGSFSGLSAQSQPMPFVAPEDTSYDDDYYDAMAVQEAPPASEDPAAAGFADALSVFGSGVKVQEINDEE